MVHCSEDISKSLIDLSSAHILVDASIVGRPRLVSFNRDAAAEHSAMTTTKLVGG